MPRTEKKARDADEARARARLRRKVLERWENEGGKVVDETANAARSGKSRSENSCEDEQKR